MSIPKSERKEDLQIIIRPTINKGNKFSNSSVLLSHSDAQFDNKFASLANRDGLIKRYYLIN